MKRNFGIGSTVGCWTIQYRAGKAKDGSWKWHCKCECGKEKDVVGYALARGKSNSCGCKVPKPPINKGKHRMRWTREYRIWCNIKDRCHNPNTSRYKDYGGRGIVMCEEWRQDFRNFFSDMGKCPPNMSIERKVNDGPYNKYNCVWATAKEQSRNTRRNISITWHGETMILTDWSDKLGLSYTALRDRIQKCHWPISRAFTEPVRGRV